LVDHVFDALDVVSVTQFALYNEVIGDGNATTSVLQDKQFLVSYCTQAVPCTIALTLTKPRL
jgi:hypothetical protein